MLAPSSGEQTIEVPVAVQISEADGWVETSSERQTDGMEKAKGEHPYLVMVSNIRLYGKLLELDKNILPHRQSAKNLSIFSFFF